MRFKDNLPLVDVVQLHCEMGLLLLGMPALADIYEGAYHVLRKVSRIAQSECELVDH